MSLARPAAPRRRGTRLSAPLAAATALAVALSLSPRAALAQPAADPSSDAAVSADVVSGAEAVAKARAGGEAPAAVAEPSGYRLDEYRTPTPETLRGARVVGTGEARALWEADEATFVDVLPRPPRPDGLPEGTLWRPTPRDDIPGSLWLPDTGHGELSSALRAYFEAGLVQASGGDPERPVVFYCKADCWMSWNAAKRALETGHRAVLWYPEGTDGWAAAGLPLERREPAADRPDGD